MEQAVDNPRQSSANRGKGPPPASPENGTRNSESWIARICLALSDIKLAHSVFALPFALLGAVLAAPVRVRVDSGTTSLMVPSPLEALQWWPSLLLIVVCMVLARTWGMLVNRLADARFDAANPRTVRRAVASGRLTLRDAWIVAISAGAGFVACCAGFWWLSQNPWPLVLSVPVLGWIALYSYTKRFTALSHLFLGGALAASPIAAAMAMSPGLIFSALGLGKVDAVEAIAQAPGAGAAILFLSGFVLFWVAGFDIAYALQDIDFDRRAGLHSIPAALGPRGSLWVSRGFHATAFALLLLAWRADPRFGSIMLPSVVTVGGLLVFEHMVLAARGVAGLPLAFFTLNGCVSVLLGVVGCVDALW